MTEGAVLWICLLVICNCFVSGSFSSEKLVSDLELTDMELADVCDSISQGYKSGILNGNFQDKTNADKDYGQLLRLTSNNLKEVDDIPLEVERNYTFLVKAGDGLLSEEDWSSLVKYHNDKEELKRVVKIPCSNNSDACLLTKGEYESILKTSKDADFLKATWTSWQHAFDGNPKEFVDVLKLVKTAATLNENDDVTAYWEFLNDFSGAYSKAKELWEEVKPLYLKLHAFVGRRLYKYYGVNETDQIPVYLLRSNFGNDWSYVADAVLPHPQLYHDVETFLKYKDLRHIYTLAENLTQAVSLGPFPKNFWSNSKFNMSYCEPHIFTYCSQDYSEVYDCNEPSWITYLDAHETAFKVALDRHDYLSLMRTKLRFSGIDEAVATLGSILAVENIHHHGIGTIARAEDDSVKMTKLLLVALRVLPQLPYYLAADEWRLQELENPSTNIAAHWWQVRNEYQGIQSVTGGELDFLKDVDITSNKPVISKYFGIIIAFQFIDYYRNMMADPAANIVPEFASDKNFLSMIKERATGDWPYLITLNYGLDISASSLLQYFKPLESYLDEAPIEQAPVVAMTTTTTTTTTSTTPATTTKTRNKSREVAPSADVQNDEPKLKTSSEPIKTSNVSMYIGVGLLVVVSCVSAAVFSYKYVKRRRRRSNNRRFQP